MRCIFIALAPVAFLAIVWGSETTDEDRGPVGSVQKKQIELPDIIKASSSDFDRFLNSFFASTKPDMELFADISSVGAAFHLLMMRHGFSPIVDATKPAITPYHDFDAFVKRSKPKLVDSPFLASASTSPPLMLAKSDKVAVKALHRSILLNHGQTDIKTARVSILVCGGDVTIKEARASVILAAGDVTLASGSEHVLVVAGGKVRIEGQTFGDFFIVTPHKVEVKDERYIPEKTRKVFFEGKRKPLFELFEFRDLADYGIRAAKREGRVQIQILTRECPFKGVLKEGDFILSAGNKNVESLAHFRRCASHALDIGATDFEVERDGKRMVVRSPVKKSQPK